MAGKLNAYSWVFTWSCVPVIACSFIGFHTDKENWTLFSVSLGAAISVGLQLLRYFKFVQLRLEEFMALSLVLANPIALVIANSAHLTHSFQDKREIAALVCLLAAGIWWILDATSSGLVLAREIKEDRYIERLWMVLLFGVYPFALLIVLALVAILYLFSIYFTLPVLPLCWFAIKTLYQFKREARQRIIAAQLA